MKSAIAIIASAALAGFSLASPYQAIGNTDSVSNGFYRDRVPESTDDVGGAAAPVVDPTNILQVDENNEPQPDCDKVLEDSNDLDTDGTGPKPNKTLGRQRKNLGEKIKNPPGLQDTTDDFKKNQRLKPNKDQRPKPNYSEDQRPKTDNSKDQKVETDNSQKPTGDSPQRSPDSDPDVNTPQNNSGSDAITSQDKAYLRSGQWKYKTDNDGKKTVIFFNNEDYSDSSVKFSTGSKKNPFITGGENKKFRDACLKAHNIRRTPEELFGVPALQWDPILAEQAAVNVAQCAMLHDTDKHKYKGKRVGQNLSTRWASNQCAGPMDHIKVALTGWVEGEVALYPKGKVDPKGPSGGVMHLTQVAWKATKRVGCAHSCCGSNSFIACNYFPAGNSGPGQSYEENVTRIPGLMK